MIMHLVITVPLCVTTATGKCLQCGRGCINRIFSLIDHFFETVTEKSEGHPSFWQIGQEALDHYGSQTGAAVLLVQKDRMLRDFLLLKRVLAGSGNPSFIESCQLLIISLGEMFPDFKTLAEVALVIPVSSVAAERGFSLQNNIKTAMRSRLSEIKSPEPHDNSLCSSPSWDIWLRASRQVIQVHADQEEGLRLCV